MNLENSYLCTDLDKEAIGRRFRQARQKAGLSQQDMAQQLGYKSAASIANKEKGLTASSLVDVHFLSFYSALSIDWIVSGTDSSLRGKDPFVVPEILSDEESVLLRQYRSLGDKLKTRLLIALIRMKDECEELSME
jgi:transcriptional regulator with XRE-family HTH domain